MRLTHLADYAVVLMTAAARRPAGDRLSATELATETGVPLPTAQKLMGQLAGAGLLSSVRGAGGGFALARPVEAINLAAILAMAAATYATRIGGLWLLRLVKVTPRLQTSLDALPVAVLTAVIAPSLARGGPADLIAAAVTLIAAMRLPLLPVVIVGVGTVVLLRHLLG